jgi:hypothetical protein
MEDVLIQINIKKLVNFPRDAELDQQPDFDYGL